VRSRRLTRLKKKVKGSLSRKESGRGANLGDRFTGKGGREWVVRGRRDRARQPTSELREYRGGEKKIRREKREMIAGTSDKMGKEGRSNSRERWKESSWKSLKASGNKEKNERRSWPILH